MGPNPYLQNIPPATPEYTLSHGTYTKVDHIQDYWINLNKSKEYKQYSATTVESKLEINKGRITGISLLTFRN